MTAQLRQFRLCLFAWSSSCLMVVACLFLSSCIHMPEPPADPDIINLLDRQLLALRESDAESVVRSTLYYDYQTKQYREGKEEDVIRVQNFLSGNPELWNFQSYTITQTAGDNLPTKRNYQMNIKVQYGDGRTRLFEFHFRYHNDEWWVTSVTGDGLLANN